MARFLRGYSARRRIVSWMKARAGRRGDQERAVMVMTPRRGSGRRYRPTRSRMSPWTNNLIISILFRRGFPEGCQLELGLVGAVLVDERAEVFRLQVRPDVSALKACSEGLRTMDIPAPKRKPKNRRLVGSNQG